MLKKWMCIMLSLAVLLSAGLMTAAFAEGNGITEKYDIMPMYAECQS